MIKGIKRILTLVIFAIISICASAQEGTYSGYSPYSVFGIGNISKEGTAYNKSMGGVGIATRNKRFINIVNPAAVTARDSLSFMGNFGLTQSNNIYKQGDIKSAHNTFNISDFVMSFPIYKSSAFMVGITPYSDMGYDFSHVITDKNIIGNTGSITYDSYGIGSVYQLFAGAGVTFWKRLSLGAEVLFMFGNLDKVTNMNFSDASYRSLNSGNKLTVRGITGKFGLQYEQKLGGNVSMILGATYRMGSGYLVNNLAVIDKNNFYIAYSDWSTGENFLCNYKYSEDAFLGMESEILSIIDDRLGVHSYTKDLKRRYDVYYEALGDEDHRFWNKAKSKS